MSGASRHHPVTFRTNLRTNLVLWPKVSENIQGLVGAVGAPYVEKDLAKRFRPESPGPAVAGDSGKASPEPADLDARVVRNTYEVLACSGLMLKSPEPKLELTTLGRCVFSFLGVTGPGQFANEANIRLLGTAMIPGLAVVTENRALWQLMRLCEDYLTNEELNRAIPIVKTIGDVSNAAEKILAARIAEDPTVIGDREYDKDKFGGDNSTDQRKAMNPQFLLAGGGEIFIRLDEDGRRSLEGWAVPLIDEHLAAEPDRAFHASTAASDVEYMSRAANAPLGIEFDV